MEEFIQGLKYGTKARYSIRRIKFIDDIKSDDWYEVWFNVGYKKIQTDNLEALDCYVIGFNQSFQDQSLHIMESNEDYNDGFLLGCGHGYSNECYPMACHDKSIDFSEGYKDGTDIGLYMLEREGLTNNNCQCRMFE
jgi:hypothetical protein